MVFYLGPERKPDGVFQLPRVQSKSAGYSLEIFIARLEECDPSELVGFLARLASIYQGSGGTPSTVDVDGLSILTAAL